MTILNLKSRKFTAAQTFLCIATVALGSRLAYKQVFASFTQYDDEGGLLLSLLYYLKHGGLYTSTFSQYGPFYFYAQQIMHGILSLPVNHDGARFLTLVYWLLSSLLAMCFLYRITASLPLASVGFLLTLITCKVLCAEPGHPQEIILVLIEGSLVLSLWAQGGASSFVFVGIGVIAAFLCLTKINVGIFFILAFAISLLALLPPGRFRKIALGTAALGSIVMPIVLMHARLKSSLDYCLLATTSIALLCFSIQKVTSGRPLSTKPLILFIAGSFAGAMLVLLIAVAQGTSVNSLLNGIVLSPLRHPGVFFRVLLIPQGQFLLAGLLFALIVFLWIVRDTIGLHPNFLGAIKVCVGIAAFGAIWLNFHLSIAIMIPLLSLLYLGQRGESRSADWLLPRLFLCFLLAFEFLQGYPVAGSQLEIGLAPGAVWACLLLFDGVTLIGGSLLTTKAFELYVWRAALALQVVFLLMVSYSHFNVRAMGPTLDLPGARRVHASQDDVSTYRALVTEIDKNCAVLFTMPGMGSLNLWSERPTPNGYNLTAWMTAFTPEEQKSIVLILRQSNRSCVVYNPKLVAFWLPQDVQLSSSPLARYVFEETGPIFSLADYQLRVPKKAN